MKVIFILFFLLLPFLSYSHDNEVYVKDAKFAITLPDTAGMKLNPDQDMALFYNKPDSNISVVVIALNTDRLDKDPMQSDDLVTVWKEEYIRNLDRKYFNLKEQPTDSVSDTWLMVYDKTYNLPDSIVMLNETRYDKKRSYLISVIVPKDKIHEAKKIISSFETPYMSYTWWTIVVYIVVMMVLFGIGISLNEKSLFGKLLCVLAAAMALYGIVWMMNIDPGYIWYSIKHLFVY